ncbi:MAG: ShlB/FhaC/HecB family hemolysin secretion/activation protein, partial [Cyanobacteria bacterium 0813]|nr:ShlB/FhaC/HecB family hemolysin secretion/activation protein [Cyanobacteria bacterium 0813]
MINWHSQAADQLILEKLLIMRPSANIAIFRLGLSLLTALPMACFYDNKAISQTNDISQLPVAADNSADTGNGVLALQKLEIKQDETATNLNQIPDFPESNPEPETQSNPAENTQDACSTIDETACGAGILPEQKNLGDNEPKCQNQLDCHHVLAQNLPPRDLNLPSPPTEPDPNRDRFLQPAPQPSPEPPQVPPTVAPSRPSPVPPALPNEAIQVQKIQVVGSTILSQDEINALVKPLEGRSATLEQLKQIADKITEIYLNRGYITSRAVLPPQTITAGLVQIQVIEGKLAKIEVEGTKRLHPSYIRSRIRLGAGMPLSTASLEDQLRLLRVDPLFDNVEASLRAGENEGESILIVRVSEANPFQPTFSIDNYSPPSVGSERLGVSLRHRNITGNGDELAAAYYRSLGDSDVFDFSYRVPLNAM